MTSKIRFKELERIYKEAKEFNDTCVDGCRMEYHFMIDGFAYDSIQVEFKK